MSDVPTPGANPYSSPAAPMLDPGPHAVASRRTVEMLRQTRPWVIFMSILGFILSAVILLAGGCMGVMGLVATTGSGTTETGIGSAVLAILNILAGVLYFIPSYHLFRYGNQIGQFLYTNQQQQLDAALEAQKSFWRFVGILTAIVMSLYLLVIVLAFFGLGAAAAFG